MRKSRAGAAVLACYGLALLAGVATLRWGAHLDPLWRLALADGAATLVVFGFSRGFDNSSFYDPYWSAAPACFVAFWLIELPNGNATRAAVVCTLVLAWGARLTWNWWRGWHGLGHEDWRYVDLRAKTGRLYWLVALVGLHAAPTVWVFLGCLALVPAFSSTRPFGVLDLVAATVMAAAIVLESTADQQLRRWTLHQKRKGDLFSGGVWGWMRHPNYAGELGFWCGLYLFAVATAPEWWWAALGPLSIGGLFVLVSIPMKDARLKATRPLYAERMRRVPALFPRRPRPNASEKAHHGDGVGAP